MDEQLELEVTINPWKEHYTIRPSWVNGEVVSFDICRRAGCLHVTIATADELITAQRICAALHLLDQAQHNLHFFKQLEKEITNG